MHIHSKRRVLVTGGTGDLGLAMVREFVEAGDEVFAAGRAAPAAGSEILKSHGLEAAHFLRMTYEDEAAIAAAVEDADADVVVLNAGITQSFSLMDVPASEWRKVVETNLTGSFLVARAAAERMVAKGRGSLIFIGTWTQDHAWPNLGAYPVSKAGLKRVMFNLALELAPKGVRVNMVSPGIIEAGMAARQMEKEPYRRERAMQRVPSGRLGEAREIAHAVAFLASEKAAYIYGVDLLVDGGISLTA
jgi:NAD(P)-dependent dehydrogenase (short-subunit alcohol dehydrogenase family)